MARPTVTEIAEEFYGSLGPWARRDTFDSEISDEWPLLHFCEGTVRGLQQVEDIIRDTDDGPGWSIVMDADRCPEEWLGWLGQFAGVRLLAGLSEADQRARVKGTDGFNRGSPGAMEAAAAQYLTDLKRVFLIERFPTPYRMTVTTITDETPDAAAVERAVMDQKPAGIILTYLVVDGDDYATLPAIYTSYEDLLDSKSSYAEVAAGV